MYVSQIPLNCLCYPFDEILPLHHQSSSSCPYFVIVLTKGKIYDSLKLTLLSLPRVNFQVFLINSNINHITRGRIKMILPFWESRWVRPVNWSLANAIGKYIHSKKLPFECTLFRMYLFRIDIYLKALISNSNFLETVNF